MRLVTWAESSLHLLGLKSFMMMAYKGGTSSVTSRVSDLCIAATALASLNTK